jgi:hypothetical protein
VNITVHRDRSQGHADLVLRWKGGALSELTTLQAQAISDRRR